MVWTVLMVWTTLNHRVAIKPLFLTMRFAVLLPLLLVTDLLAQNGSDPAGRQDIKVCWNGTRVDFVRIDDRRAPIAPGTCVTMKLMAGKPLRISVQQGSKATASDSLLLIAPETGELRLSWKDSTQPSAGLAWSYESHTQRRERFARQSRDSAERVAAAAVEAARLAKEKQEAKELALRNLIVQLNGRKLKVYDKDLGPLDWPAAVEACQRLGNGWRLPTEPELRAIQVQLHREGAGSFSETWYWTATEDGPERAWIMHMAAGNVNRNPRNHSMLVRPVRDIR
jgi:hypothetical protein